jgi:protein arginine kinase
MRNLRGYRFPHAAPEKELKEIQKAVFQALENSARNGKPYFEIVSQLSPAQREYLVGCRLMSPDFSLKDPGRALLLDRKRAVAVMVNEEDHLRIQALTPGWTPNAADKMAAEALLVLGQSLRFAQSETHGYLAASPYNCGEGKRYSAMLHLTALAHSKRLPAILKALIEKGIYSRGAFGEASKAVGAFVQISATTASRDEFLNSATYLIEQERLTRQSLPKSDFEKKCLEALTFTHRTPAMTLGDALRVLSWVRLAACEDLNTSKITAREADSLLTTLEVRSTSDPSRAAQQRAEFLRESLGL